MIASVDEFILYDDMQFTRRDWRNRNQIKTPNGARWLTVPVKVKGRFHQTIRETELSGTEWAVKHWQTISHSYIRAAHFPDIAVILEPLYLHRKYRQLSCLNLDFMKAVCAYLGITTKISDSSDYDLIDGKSARLADLCKQAKGTEYLSGPAAKDYLEERYFSEQNIKLCWMDYNGYPEYPQLWGDFTHQVSIIDLLFNCGKNAPKYMKYVRL